MRVLIVEDDHRLATSIRQSLEEVGIAADAVYDGEDAVAAAIATAYDAILLDVMLPKVDGISVSRQLRSRRMHAPILMLTAKDAVDDRVRGLEAGADDYLIKPFAMREVVARIKALTRRHLPDRGTILVAGPYALDTGARVLKVHGKQVPLTAKEFAILEYFMLHRGQVLSRDQIIEHAWDYDFDGGRNLIEVYLNRLRRKLAPPGTTDPFVTMRGAGYRFEP